MLLIHAHILSLKHNIKELKFLYHLLSFLICRIHFIYFSLRFMYPHLILFPIVLLSCAHFVTMYVISYIIHGHCQVKMDLSK